MRSRSLQTVKLSRVVPVTVSRRGSMSAGRRGITLLEVMISIFVLAIGLLGTASLLPVASLQARRANLADRKSAVLQSEVRDFKTRSFLRPDYWRYADGNAVMNSTTAPYNFITDAANSSNVITLPAVAIDPLMIASVGTSGSTATFASNGGSLVMPRITLTNMFGAAASQACLMQDDMVFTLNKTDSTVLPTGGFNANQTRRAYQGQFSWLATLVPVYGDSQTSFARNSMILSVVAFNQRRFQTAPVQGASTDTERAATVTFSASTGTAYGGGDLIISSTNQNSLNLTVGEWLMLGWMMNDVPPTGTNTNYTPRPYFRWYRILNATPAVLTGSTWNRAITVNGADINLSAITSGTATAFIYDGAVGVYERPVHLEGPSLWSN